MGLIFLSLVVDFDGLIVVLDGLVLCRVGAVLIVIGVVFNNDDRRIGRGSCVVWRSSSVGGGGDAEESTGVSHGQ